MACKSFEEGVYQKTNMIMAFEAKVELMAFTCDKGHLLAIVYESVMYMYQ